MVFKNQGEFMDLFSDVFGQSEFSFLIREETSGRIDMGHFHSYHRETKDKFFQIISASFLAEALPADDLLFLKPFAGRSPSRVLG